MLHSYPLSYLQDDLHKIPKIFHFNEWVTNYPQLFTSQGPLNIVFVICWKTKNVQLSMNMS